MDPIIDIALPNGEVMLIGKAHFGDIGQDPDLNSCPIDDRGPPGFPKTLYPITDYVLSSEDTMLLSLDEDAFVETHGYKFDYVAVVKPGVGSRSGPAIPVEFGYTATFSFAT